MLKVEVIETVYHTATLSDEDEEKVLAYIKSNPEKFEYMDAEEKITKAVWDLYFEENAINIYKNTVDSEAETEAINWSEFEERSADEILGAFE